MATVGNKTYSSESDIPDTLPVFPLSGALLLPRTQLPLNIFEPRYLAMVDDSIGSHRLIGMIQPSDQRNAGSSPPLHRIGCAGRITSFQETSDGRYMINLAGVCRFVVLDEVSAAKPYRICRITAAPFADDLIPGRGEEDVNRQKLLEALRRFLNANGMEADWDSIAAASTEMLVNALCAMSPFDPREKQALLEAQNLAKRAETLVALTEFSLAGDDGTHHLQ